MYPGPKVPRHGKSLYKPCICIYICRYLWLFMGKLSPRIPRLNATNTMGPTRTLGVHPPHCPLIATGWPWWWYNWHNPVSKVPRDKTTSLWPNLGQHLMKSWTLFITLKNTTRSLGVDKFRGNLEIYGNFPSPKTSKHLVRRYCDPPKTYLKHFLRRYLDVYTVSYGFCVFSKKLSYLYLHAPPIWQPSLKKTRRFPNF